MCFRGMPQMSLWLLVPEVDLVVWAWCSNQILSRARNLNKNDWGGEIWDIKWEHQSYASENETDFDSPDPSSSIKVPVGILQLKTICLVYWEKQMRSE